MRVQHTQQAMRGIHASAPQGRSGLNIIDGLIERFRHLIWNDRSDEALGDLSYIPQAALGVAYISGETFRSAVVRLLWNCDDLRCYLENAGSSLINCGECYGSRLPISTSRAEGRVNEVADARRAEKQRMRGSPQEAHRATILDNRVGQPLDRTW